MDALIFALGAALLAFVLWDIFQSVVVPRPTPGRLRLARYVIPPTWRLWRWLGMRRKDGLSRDWLLGMYAPGAAILLFGMWIAVIILADSLMLWAVRTQVTPSPANFGDALYFAGESTLTIGYGDIVASGLVPRLVVLFAGATGLGVVALVITFLFSLFGSYQRREVLVVALSARAKSPPSAVTLLETYARLDLVDELPSLFREWEQWSAEVLDSHVAYPLLGYFRSSHDNVSWISAVGALLDAAALVVTTIREVPRGQAEITLRVGAHLVEDISNYQRLAGDGSRVDFEAFSGVYDRLAQAGYALDDRDEAWRSFEHARGKYAGRLETLAAYWATPAPSWVGVRAHGGSVLHMHRQPTPTEVIS